MIISSVKELNSARARVTRLEQDLAEELASLPAAYGFDSLKAFVAAIKAAGGRGKAGRPNKLVGPKARKRATITDAVRVKVKALVKDGKTGSYIAKALKISLPSVQNIKKALGLVKKSKKAPAKPRPQLAPAKAKAARKSKRKPVPPKKTVVREKAVVSMPKLGPAAAEPAPVPAA